jgi:hypothetical protein
MCFVCNVFVMKFDVQNKKKDFQHLKRQWNFPRTAPVDKEQYGGKLLQGYVTGK